MNRALFPVRYTDEFEAFWKAYGPVPNSSKSDAFKAWGQTKGSRPEQSILLRCVDLANTWLFEETQRRNGKGKAPKPHAATWLRQARWESWIERAGLLIQGQNNPPAPSPRRSFRADIDHPSLPEHFTPKRSIKDILNQPRKGLTE